MYINQPGQFLLEAGSFAYNSESAMQGPPKKMGRPFFILKEPKQSIWGAVRDPIC